jgi:hypothetical protein
VWAGVHALANSEWHTRLLLCMRNFTLEKVINHAETRMGRGAETTIAHAGARVELTIPDAPLRKSFGRQEIAVKGREQSSCNMNLDFSWNEFQLLHLLCKETVANCQCASL